jgi:predicted RNA-binding protein associated with RNAse of E/G family
LIDASEEHIVLAHRAFPSRPMVYGGREVMGSGYEVVWFLYKGKPFDVGRFYRPDGSWTGYYVDILEPVRWEDADADTLEPIVDLFLDLWIDPAGGHLVLDEDEFEEAVEKKYLSSEQAERARETLRNLVAATENGTFPPEEVRTFRR